MIVCFKDRISPFSLLLFVCMVFTFSSCLKKEDTVGDDFVGAIVGFDVQSSDTSTLIAYTSQDDSVNTRLLTYYYLGQINDADLGIATSSIITQFSLPILGNSYDNSTAKIDSIVVQLKYFRNTSYYGNQQSIQEFTVYQLAENLNYDSVFRSNRNYAYNAAIPLGSTQTSFNHMEDSIKFQLGSSLVALPGHMRINISDPSFIQYFKNAPNSVFANDASFIAYFKGLIIIPTTNPLGLNEGAIANIDLRNDNFNRNTISSVVVYYNDSLSASFPIYNDVNIRLNQFKHQHTITIPVQPLLGGSHQNMNYVKGNAGLKTRILIPHLFDYIKNKNIAISKAELIVTAANARDNAPFELSPVLSLYDSDENGRTTFIRDYNPFTDSRNYYGGIETNNTYTFTITKHIQYLFKQYQELGVNQNYGLNLFVSSDPYRVILDTSPGKLKLKLSYTVIK
jgi:hypothetical protein